MASPGRSGQGGLSLQTVVIASLASATAAIVTSRLLPPGATIFTAAMTPVIVAFVSDLLHRPARRVTELRERRTAVLREPARAGGPPEAPWAPIEEGLDSLRDEPALPSSNGAAARREYRRRRIHPKWIAATATIAFVLAVGVLTIPELLFGGALGSDRRTTVFGGSDTPAQKDEARDEAPAETRPEEEAPPVQMEPEDDPEASPQPTETEPTPEPAPEPTETAPAPEDPAAPVPELP